MWKEWNDGSIEGWKYRKMEVRIMYEWMAGWKDEGIEE
jgi:hypothetical protein